MKPLLFFICLLVSGKSYSQDAAAILTQASKMLESKKSVSYRVVSGQKFLDYEDTSKIEGHVRIMRNEKDSTFGGHFFMGGKFLTGMGEFITRVYDGQYIYDIALKKDTATRYSVAARQEWIINGNLSRTMLWTDFLMPSKITGRIDSANKLTLLKDTMVDKELCYRITIRYPDEPAFTNQVRTMLIRKKDVVTVYSAFQVNYQGKTQYDFIRLSDIVFDKVGSGDFTLKQFKGIALSDYREMSKEEREAHYKLLDTNILAPVLEGRIHNSSGGLTRIDYTGKVILLDFWYMSCVWCIKSFPYIEKLRQKYGDKLTVYGVNAFDNNENAIAKIPQFLEFNPMGYQTVLTDRSVVDAFKVKVWPTFYLIGPDGKIKYSQAGAIANEEIMKKWEGAIEKLIGK